MKKLLLLLALVSLSLASYPQRAKDSFTVIHKGLWLKGNVQKGAGSVLAAGGLLLMFWAYEMEEQYDASDFNKELVSLGGVGLLLPGAFLLERGERNRKRASQLRIQPQKITVPQGTTLVLRRQPALTLQVPL